MEWADDEIVLGVRRHGEASIIVELMTRGHGRHLGLVRGGSGSRMRPVLQPGNSVHVVWRARLDEHLGTFAVEGLNLRAAAFLTASYALYAITHLAALCRLLPERDPHPSIHDALAVILDRMDASAGSNIVRFELMMLAELGFGLDLAHCAATGTDTDLVYVSPKSGRAVSRKAGDPWKDKLLRLPMFLSRGEEEVPSSYDLADGFALTGFFLLHHVLDPRGLALSEAREGLIMSMAEHRSAQR